MFQVSHAERKKKGMPSMRNACNREREYYYRYEQNGKSQLKLPEVIFSIFFSFICCLLFHVHRRVQSAERIAAFAGIQCVVNSSPFGLYSSISVHHMAKEHKLSSHVLYMKRRCICSDQISHLKIVILILFIIYQHWLFNRTQEYIGKEKKMNKTWKGWEGKIKNKTCSHRNC